MDHAWHAMRDLRSARFFHWMIPIDISKKNGRPAALARQVARIDRWGRGRSIEPDAPVASGSPSISREARAGIT